MSRQKRNNKKNSWKISTFIRGISEETKMGIVSVVFFVIALFLAMAPFKIAGLAGQTVFEILNKLIGNGYALLPIIITMASVALIKQFREHIFSSTIIGAALFLSSTTGIIDAIFREKTYEAITGGSLGYYVSKPFLFLLGTPLGVISLAGISIISFLIMFNTKITLDKKLFGFSLDKKIVAKEGEDYYEQDALEGKTEENVISSQPEKSEKKADILMPPKDEPAGEMNIQAKSRKQAANYIIPPISLLSKETGKPSVGDIKANANIIKRTLYNFGIDVEMDEISIGPSVTRYAFKPAEGVKISRILSLHNDLALALAAHPIRIEAPIPGRSLVGIEIPNTIKAIVRLSSLIASKKFQETDKPLLIALGKGTSGIPHFANLAKAPHMLIAGATGSGKSVAIHSIITSLLYKNSPEKMRLILIDPKRVELTLYNGIPHLLSPVITNPKKAILSLKWAAKEMERRYDILEKAAARDIESYHKNILNPYMAKSSVLSEDDAPENLPYIIIVIDELADIMSMYPKELEAGIVRLAQMSRAVGIHLLLSTQRPSVEVITGLIKANIPSRIALQVPSQIDSRTILDSPGAEKLLGAGDMLYMSGEISKPYRIQSAFITEDEVKKISHFLKVNNNLDISDNIIISDGSEIIEPNAIFESLDVETQNQPPSDEDETIYQQAKEIVLSSGKASTSYLQRRLRLGYARAARIIDLLEERGIVGPQDGSKQREVYGFSKTGGNMLGGDIILETDENEGYDTPNIDYIGGEDEFSETETVQTDQQNDQRAN